jgi:Tfp pilus assembly protein PilF
MRSSGRFLISVYLRSSAAALAHCDVTTGTAFLPERTRHAAMSAHQKPSQKESETEILALQALQRGELARARALCDEMLADNSASPIALRLLGLVNMLERRYEAAIDAFTRSVTSLPEPGTFINLTTCLTKIGNLERALDSGRAAVAMAPGSVAARTALALTLQGMRRAEEALLEVEEAERLSPGNPAVIVRRGAIRAHLGHYDAAEQDFAVAAASNDTPQCRAVRFNRAFYDALGAAAGDRVPERAQLVSMGSSDDARYVVYVGCTADYFCKYGVVFVNSYAANSASGNLLHLHIVNPHERFTNGLSDIARRLPALNLVVTTERAPIDAATDPGNAKSYYASARFIQLADLLAHYRRPILSFDVDAVVEAPLDRLLDHIGNHDLGLVLREPVDSPWWDIIAYIVGVRPTPLTLEYLRRVRNYILHFLDRRQMPWALDQISLYCVLKMMGRFDTAPAVAWIPRELQAVTWQIGQAYDYKLSDERVRRYS